MKEIPLCCDNIYYFFSLANGEGVKKGKRHLKDSRLQPTSLTCFIFK